jgi:hypothetical protein
MRGSINERSLKVGFQPCLDFPLVAFVYLYFVFCCFSVSVVRLAGIVLS